MTETQARERQVVLSDKPTCPHCRRPAFGATWSLGDVFMWCKAKHCPGERFRVIALPLGTRGDRFLRIFGEVAGRILLQRCKPEVPLDQLLASELVTWPFGNYVSLGLSAEERRHGPSVMQTQALLSAFQEAT